MSWLLDTNIISELRRPTAVANPGVVEWAASQDPDSLYLSAITVLELEIGVRRKERTDAVQGAMLRRWLDGDVLPTFSGRIVSVDTAVAVRAGTLHVPDPRPERDALIAATATVHGLTVVTRNIRDFADLGATLLNPWSD
ncbi:type II toxin-antitoxin system VapC family toxin [Agromyces protaetiae]|uniref:Ribonuclease VapC n=1 Tax=Agromyces protaetiae TaxID=2509455 RepID=A0A4P6F8Y1_9MICO|nr:type II toxin-antitoxin system VapC family toxin [Agromyces protaetiae]QAY72025.1 type II toxin-antitoxin system VapC family toxin [Agromyces protaetiae]